jgi:hypothetical protein
LLAISPGVGTAADAFQAAFGLSDNTLSFERCPAGACLALGWTKSSTLVWMNPFVYSKDSNPNSWWERTVHLIVHEMGHVFNAAISNAVDQSYYLYNALTRTQSADPSFPDRIATDPELKGFAGPRYNWQQSSSDQPGEEFADMFLGWTYNRWERNPDGSLTGAGRSRAAWIAARMPL